MTPEASLWRQPAGATFSRTTAPANPYSRKSRDIHHVPELSTSSDSSDGAMEVADGYLEEFALFDLYEAMYVPLPKMRFSDNSGDEPTAEPAPANHVDTTVSQPFRRWMSTLRRRHLERRKGRHMEASRLSSDLGDGNTDGTIPSNHLHEYIRGTSESMTSSIGMKTASLTVGSTSIALGSDAGCRGEGRVGRSSHYSDARRSMDSHRSTLGPIVD
jgi:hypothetical protein